MKIHALAMLVGIALAAPVAAQAPPNAPGDRFVTSAGRTPAGLIIVTEENFVVAETDRYMQEHTANHPVNTIRHSRGYSNIDNQVVIRENEDALYSHAVVDVSRGAVIRNPAWNRYSIIQIIDENHYSFAHLYPGEAITITPDMVTLGSHVWLNIRTEVRPNDGEGYFEAHRHQDAYVIEAVSANPYVPKGFDRESQARVRAQLLTRTAGINSWDAFGVASAVKPEDRLVASASGWAGLPKEHALYFPRFIPNTQSLARACSRLTLPRPPLDFDTGGFFSVTVYGADGFIATRNYAVSHRNAQANDDGTYTFHFNCPGRPNNMTTVENWNVVLRLYRPTTVEGGLAYLAALERAGTEIEVVSD